MPFMVRLQSRLLLIPHAMSLQSTLSLWSTLVFILPAALLPSTLILRSTLKMLILRSTLFVMPAMLLQSTLIPQCMLILQRLLASALYLGKALVEAVKLRDHLLAEVFNPRLRAFRRLRQARLAQALVHQPQRRLQPCDLA